MNKTIKRLWNDQEGQGFAEYALILALVAVVAMATLSPLGTTIRDKFTEVTNGLTPAAAAE